MPEGPDTGIFDGIPEGEPRHNARRKSLLLAERGIVFDAYVNDHEVTREQPLDLHLLAWNTGVDTVSARFQWSAPSGFVPADGESCTNRFIAVAPGAVARCAVRLVVDGAAEASQPYYLREAIDGALYTWTGGAGNFGLPFERGINATVVVHFADGSEGVRSIDVTARSLDQGLGEVRRPVTVVPPVLLELSPGRFLWPAGQARRVFNVNVEHATRDTITATIRLIAPDGWQVDPPQEVKFTAEGERRALRFVVTAPEGVKEQEAIFLAEAVVGESAYRLGARRINYPHIRERVIFSLASSSAVLAPVEFASGRKVGYLRGAADRIPEVLQAAGVPFRLLGDDDLSGPLLDSLDVLVIGPRAYETSIALQRAHPRVLKFAADGGTLVIQYQQYQFIQGGFAPLPFTIARPHDRITDETAAVRWLPGSELLQRRPNRLEQEDFSGWVQERGLYFANTWDERWSALMEMDEPGEQPRRGGLLVAEYGKGKVVYTGIAFFRQLPAAVPGAWRLFANLLAL